MTIRRRTACTLLTRFKGRAIGVVGMMRHGDILRAAGEVGIEFTFADMACPDRARFRTGDMLGHRDKGVAIRMIPTHIDRGCMAFQICVIKAVLHITFSNLWHSHRGVPLPRVETVSTALL